MADQEMAGMSSSVSSSEAEASPSPDLAQSNPQSGPDGSDEEGEITSSLEDGEDETAQSNLQAVGETSSGSDGGEQDENSEDSLQDKKKRKRSVSQRSNTQSENPDVAQDEDVEQTEQRKRSRPDVPSTSVDVDEMSTDKIEEGGAVPARDWSTLPSRIWQSTLEYLPPAMLARMMLINKSFYHALEVSNARDKVIAPQVSSHLDGLDGETIWTSSRKTFCANAPKPLKGHSELDMWKLLLGRRCQSCAKLDSDPDRVAANPPWEPALGSEGIALVCPFRVRICGDCFLKQTDKEIDLLISSSIPSALLAAVPFAFVSPSVHVVTPTALQSAASTPQFQMTKHFLKTDLEDIKKQFEEVKTLGSAAAENWFKGLGETGQEWAAEAARWERWLQGPRRTGLRKHVLAALTEAPSHGASNDVPNLTNGEASAGLTATANTLASSSQAVSSQGTRSERSVREVNELKASRRTEIERRCEEMDPPIPASVLFHMDSFQAAIQISSPLTDSAWEILKPRLLAQREAATQRERERTAQDLEFKAKFEERRQQEASAKEAKEIQDRIWEEVQNPIKEGLAQFAQQIIKDVWKGGDLINHDTCPKFAADVLLFVRERFYAQIAEEDSKAIAAGQQVKRDSPEGPPSRKLILENMKWVFDTQIKPLTEKYRKELFLCHGCEHNFKFYGFEGVIQHYAAKHTSALSVGSVVVHWKSEWPAYPPFHPDPNAARAAFFANGPHVAMASQPHGHHRHQGGYPYQMGYGGYPQGQGAHGPQSGPNGMHGYQGYPPAPYGQQQQYGEHFHGHPGGGYPPNPYQQQPGQFPPSPQSFPGSQGYQRGQPGYTNPPPAIHGQQGYPPFQGPSPQPYGPPSRPQSHPQMPGPLPPGAPPQGQPTPNGPRFNQGPSAGAYGAQYKPPPAKGAPSVVQGQQQGVYTARMEDLAKFARDAWTATSGIKDFPSNIRTWILIHHTDLRMKAKFGEGTTLTMFVDALLNNSLMKPIKNFSGLACRACIQGAGHLDAGGQQLDKKMYALPNLLQHFQTVHIDRPQSTIDPATGGPVPPSDWKTEMVDLPNESVISGLIRAPGMDDSKLQLIAHIFPQAFPNPLPKLGNGQQIPTAHEERPGRNGKDQLRDRKRNQPDANFETNLRVKHGPALPTDGDHVPPHPSAPGVSKSKAKANKSGKPGATTQYPEVPNGMSKKQRKQIERAQTRNTRVSEDDGAPRAKKQKHQPNPNGEGSEDGEVASSDSSPNGAYSKGEGNDSAAERFLDTFLPGEDAEAYKRKAAEHARRKEEQAYRVRPDSGERGGSGENKPLKALDGAGDGRYPPRGKPGQEGKQASARHAAIPGGHEPSVSPVAGGYAPPQYMRGEVDQASAYAGRQAESSDEAEGGYVPQRGGAYGEDRNGPNAGQPRQRNRYERYDNQRQGRMQLRSKSPRRMQSQAQGAPYAPHPDAQAEHGYRARSPLPVGAEDQSYYSRPVAKGHHYPSDPYVTYANGSGPRGYGQPQPESQAYHEEMDYMPVRMPAGRNPPQGQGRGAPVPVGHRPEYVRYEEEPQGRPVYDERSQLYRTERAYYVEDDPYQHLRY